MPSTTPIPGVPSVRIESRSLPAGADQAVHYTIRQMQALVKGKGGVQSPWVREAALEAVRGTERGQAEVDSVYNWVKDNIEFRGEYEETLQAPEATLRLRAGDCDDHAMLLAALLQSLGYKTRFRTVAPRSDPEFFSHVFVEVEDKREGGWISLDSTNPRAFPGWEPPSPGREQTYRIMAPQNPRDTLLNIGLFFGAFALLDWFNARQKRR